jgi:hypothetical protein
LHGKKSHTRGTLVRHGAGRSGLVPLFEIVVHGVREAHRYYVPVTRPPHAISGAFLSVAATWLIELIIDAAW